VIAQLVWYCNKEQASHSDAEYVFIKEFLSLRCYFVLHKLTDASRIMTLFNIFLKEAVKMAIKYRGSPIFLK
jgi:hypothetical protein